MTIQKRRYLLGNATAVLGDRKIGELTSQEIAERRMRLSPGDRFEATRALRQVLQRATHLSRHRSRQSGAAAGPRRGVLGDDCLCALVKPDFVLSSWRLAP
jgi:hypothetical protein